MNIFHISLNNLKRRKVKMIFLMLGLVVGVATVIALTNIIQAMHIELGDRIDEFGANAIILPRTEGMEMNYGNNVGSDLYLDLQKLTMDDIPKIYESSVAEYINIVSPKLVGAVEAGDQKTIIVGIEPREEFFQKPWFSLKEQAGNQDNLVFIELPEDSIILGSAASEALNMRVGDQVTINQQTFHVYGILDELGSEEDGLIFANLGVVQELLGRPGELSMIEVSAYCNSCPIEEIAMGLEDAMPNSRVTPLRQAALFREETIDNFSSFGIALSSMVLIIAALVVLTTMLSSVNERTREIGIFRAIGFRRSHIIQIIILEVAMVSIIGGIIGYFSGSLMAKYAGPYIAQIQGDIPLQLDLLLPAILLSTGLAIITSIYPAIKAAKLDPAEALRFI
ncbi:ABC transporter permease [Alkalicella caledoniensis]|uniref:ABC transporter permease n=1 Tax=Alkalicella caledoniensis TaxID=2731377 RepID=A0A7G9W426_ALKCA|nr:FtsX-like permease family protein [Alkalicella caledoniensis]QNO13438.1 ABC transporter permease [Alkalicella caledoniensis]